MNQPDDLGELLGPRPTDGVEAQAWDEAVARIDQHRTAFGLTDTVDLLERRVGWGDTAQDVSHRSVTQACQQLDRTLGREAEVDLPGLSL